MCNIRSKSPFTLPEPTHQLRRFSPQKSLDPLAPQTHWIETRTLLLLLQILLYHKHCSSKICFTSSEQKLKLWRQQTKGITESYDKIPGKYIKITEGLGEVCHPLHNFKEVMESGMLAGTSKHIINLVTDNFSLFPYLPIWK